MRKSSDLTHKVDIKCLWSKVSDGFKQGGSFFLVYKPASLSMAKSFRFLLSFNIDMP